MTRIISFSFPVNFLTMNFVKWYIGNDEWRILENSYFRALKASMEHLNSAISLLATDPSFTDDSSMFHWWIIDV